MKILCVWRWAVCWLAVMLASAVVAQPSVTPPAETETVAVPAWTAPVMDLSQTLDQAQIQALLGQVHELEAQQGSQLFVLLVPTTGSDTIEQYTRRVFDQWAVGRKGIDDGVLLLVAMRDRRVRIEVGYGLEGAVPDVAAGRIIREQITPRFAQDDVFGGLQAGVSALQALIRGETLPSPQGTEDDAREMYVMALPLIIMTLMAPVWLGAALAGGFLWIATGSIVWALVGVLGGLAVGVLGRVLGLRDKLSRGRSGGRGGGGGFGGGGFGGGGGGFGGGGRGGGGGGRGGGGGASGGW